MTARLRRHADLFALAGALAAALMWFALASLTGLIFHFMPAGPIFVAAGIVRWAEDRNLGRNRRIAILSMGSAIALVMTLVIALTGRPLDEPVITGLVIAAGVAIGAWLLRPAAFGAARSEIEPADVGHHTVDRVADE